MSNRTRTIQQQFYVSPEELAMIHERMRLLNVENKSAYLRKMAANGYIINIDTTDIKENTAQLQRIGNNINQIVRRMNQTGSLYVADVEEVKKLLAEIWRMQRALLLSQRGMDQ